MVATKKDKVSGDCLGTGRRKKAIARVRIRPGSGKILINGREMKEYFPIIEPAAGGARRARCHRQARAGRLHHHLHGGGPNGQAFACKMGIARALIALDGETFPTLRDGGYLTRDSRMKERKKYGLRGARRGVQFSKR